MKSKHAFCVWAPIAFVLLAGIVMCGQTNQDKRNAQSATSVNTTALPASTTDAIEKLSAKELVQRRDELQDKIKGLTDQIGYLRDVQNFTRQLDDAKKRNQAVAVKELETRIFEYEPYAGLAKGEGITANLSNETARRQREIDAILPELKAVESKMNYKIDIDSRQQDFKRSVSIIFACIVGGVIVGFFLVAVIDAKVRQEIFAEQVGIQFITLFSLVIAIILFGITGVLEGKELAALLGGLAGYILGRSGTGVRTTSGEAGAGGAATGVAPTTGAAAGGAAPSGTATSAAAAGRP